MLKTREQPLLQIRRNDVLETSIAAEMLRLFRGDNRRVMQQRATGGYGVLHSGALTYEDLRQHLRGDVSASIYLLDENAHCATLCFDIDIPKIDIPEGAIEREQKKRSELLQVVTQVVGHIQSTYSIPDEAFLLEDTGGRGYHVWLFFEKPQPADSVIMFGHEVKRSVRVEGIEIFPPSPKHGPSGFSKSNVRLPLGIHRKYQGTRSAFLELRSGEAIPITGTATHLRKVTFVSAAVLKMTRTLVTEQVELGLAEVTKEPIEVRKTVKPQRHIAYVGKMLLLCPALSDSVAKTQRNGHLAHHERIALALTLMHCTDGEKRLHEIMSYCSDYSVDETQKHIDSLAGYYPISCRRLQGIEYNVCPGWCCPQFERAAAEGRSPTPLWFARLSKHREDIKTDGSEHTLIERIATIQNLHQAWKQARLQAKEQEIFEDVLAYEAFEEHLWANLHVLRADLLSGTWRHGPFYVVLVPKKKGNLDNARPMCLATPWDSIVALAVLNITGPPIDSTFHENSLGNRLARGPKTDGQVFEDWRKQNRYREIRRDGFSEYGERYYYVLTDIGRFYEFVRHDRLMTLLRVRIDDQKVLDILQQFLEAEWLLNGSPLPRTGDDGSLMGLPQGAVLSAFLANLYLDGLDHWLEKKCVDFVRYVDDLALLFESEEDAKKTLDELQKVLEKEFSLELTDAPEKKLGPFPASDIRGVTDWIQDARYELVKYSRRASSLNVVEKNEMRAALTVVAGAKLKRKSDLYRLVKYLGFYIANTERLEQPELQTGVHALALYVLNEERPKHNATCIAMRALIKACTEFGDSAWHELKELLGWRQDEYIRVVLAQETRRFLEADVSQQDLYPELLKAIEEQAATSSPILAAAAITCLASAGKTSMTSRDVLWNISMGDDSYVRSRAAIVLSRFGALTSTAAARIIPEHGDEAALFLLSLQSVQSKAVVDSTADVLGQVPMASHAASALLFAGLSTGSEKGIATCVSLECLNISETKHHICHYVAAKYVNTVVGGQNQASDLETAIKTGVAGGLPTIARQLYDLGRYSRVIAELPEVDTILEGVEGNRVVAGVTALPAIKGVSLGKLLISINPGVWLHEAVTADGTPVYHEIVTGSELQPLGQGVVTLTEVLDAFRKTNLLLVDKVEVQKVHGTEYAIVDSTRDDEWQSVTEWIRDSGPCAADETAAIVRKAAELLHRLRDELYRQNLPLDLLPVPTCHTLFINTARELRFRNITATIAGGRRYVSLSKHPLELPREYWIVFALGLLLFEVSTGKCVVSAIQNSPRKDRLTETADCKANGALFAGIVGKATAHRTDSQYDNPQLFLKDVEEWSRLETAIGQHSLGGPLIERLRHFWHIQLGLERRTHLAVQRQRSFLDAASWLATYVLKELEEGGELEDAWLKPKLRKLVIQLGSQNSQVTTLQTRQLTEALEEQWTDLTRSIGLKRTFTCQDWLKYAVAANEMETVRRALCLLAKGPLRRVCEQFCITVGISISEGRKLRIGLSDGHQTEYEGQALADVTNGLATVSERLLRWLAKSTPDALWPTDLLVIATVLLVMTEGIVLQGNGNNNVCVGPEPNFKVGERVKQLIEGLLRLYGRDVRGFCTVSEDTASVHQTANLALSCSDLLNQLRFTERYFATLPESAFQKLYADQLAQLDLAPVLDRPKQRIPVSKSALLPFPSLSPFHGEGCPFSVDLIEHDDGAPNVVALSLPLVVRQDEDNIVYPRFCKEEPRKQTRGVRRLLTCCFGLHALLLLPPLGLYLCQVYIRSTGLVLNASWASTLDSWIGSLATGLFFLPYVAFCAKRFARSKEDVVTTNRRDVN